ncbi:hypothetical protein A5657_18130 [Mycobacterium kubicae]|nr:hypothetical protein A5657_18130 [Mycobacterium kubicae]
MADPARREANICLRLGGVDDDYEVIAIDVDHYRKGDRDKRGGDQLEALENAHGKLPATWTSSSRTDGISGKRFYRVPRGHAFRGQVDKDIECLQKGHRFAVVWPSFNPDSQAIETWFPPGAPLTEAGRRLWDGVIPDATMLEVLPKQWVDYLTRGRMRAGKVEIDMDSSVDEIYGWADDTFHGDNDTQPCAKMREKLDRHLKLIEQEATSHDKIVNAHMSIFHLAAEGHHGWAVAVNEVEQKFADVCQKRDKRTLEELRSEIFRSRINGLRKIKAKIETAIAAGVVGVPASDLECADTSGVTVPNVSSGTPTSKTPATPQKPAKKAATPSAQQVSQSPAFFAQSGGLLVRTLADSVTSSVTCGYNQTNNAFYVYDAGVFTPDNNRIDAHIVGLLDERWRPTHTANALGVIRHHRSTRNITCTPDARWINTANGMVDWRNGARFDHSPNYGSTVQLPVEFHAEAACPAVDQFLAEVLPLDCYTPTEDCPQGFIWELIGYAMYSGNPHHIAVMLWGKGRNGKGALIRLIKALLGEANCASVGLQELVENRFRAAELYGKLANLVGDLDPTWLKNTAMFKSITGADTIAAERKFGQPFTFTPWALPIYSTNKPFGSADSSEGWNDRWIVVPFPRSFTDDDKDVYIDAKLQNPAELQGAMARGIAALRTLMKRGHLAIPPSVAEAKQQFILASDSVRSWIDSYCVLKSGVFTSRTELFSAYQTDTALDGTKQLSNREFYSRVEQIAGIDAHKRDGVRGFRGIRRKTLEELLKRDNDENVVVR